MKTVITAIANPIINNELKKEKNIEVIGNDIQSKDGVIEILEKNIEVNYIILSDILIGEELLINLIRKINEINKNIKIIIILTNENKKEYDNLISIGVKKIFYNNKVEIKEILDIINEENDTDKLIEEINSLKKIILENKNINNIQNKEIIKEENKKNNNKEKSTEKINNKKTNKLLILNKFKILNKIKNKFYKYIPNNILKKYNKSENCEVISVLGAAGVGKSIFTVNLANSYIYSKKKILIIDFDVLNNSLHTILGLKKYSKIIREKLKNNNLINNKINIKELTIKITNKIDLISGINLLFDSKYKISSEKIYNIINELKANYEIIIIDNSAECFFDYTKNIIENSNINIFITEANLSEIKKSKNLLNIYINKWNINKNKINILFNKYNKNSIDINILKNIFSEFNILGKLNFDEKYNLIINKNGITCDNKIMKEYININKKIEEGNLTKINS